MTLKAFFRKARCFKWRVTPESGLVRCARGFCPLGAVARIPALDIWGRRMRRLARSPSEYDAAAALGLRVSQADKIARAADVPDDRHRAWLEKNLGIAP